MSLSKNWTNIFIKLAYLSISHPAAGLDLIRVQPPVFQLLLEERPAHVGRVVQLSRPVVVEDLSKHARVAVEEVLVEDGVVISEVFCESGQPRGRDLLERRFVRLVADAAAVEDAPVVGIHGAAVVLQAAEVWVLSCCHRAVQLEKQQQRFVEDSRRCYDINISSFGPGNKRRFEAKLNPNRFFFSLENGKICRCRRDRSSLSSFFDFADEAGVVPSFKTKFSTLNCILIRSSLESCRLCRGTDENRSWLETWRVCQEFPRKKFLFPNFFVSSGKIGKSVILYPVFSPPASDVEKCRKLL